MYVHACSLEACGQELSSIMTACITVTVDDQQACHGQLKCPAKVKAHNCAADFAQSEISAKSF